ncbi:MAG: AAA family ATPase [Clostridiales bacterium]|nr:AAA family ATPase [Clostridiales bacterium]
MKIKLAILEHDKNYLSRVITAFNNRFADKLQVYSFTKADEVTYSTIKDVKIDVLISSDHFDIDFSQIPKACAFAYFVESPGIEQYNDRPAICKFQKADLIYKEILNIFSEVAANISGVSLSGDETSKVILFTSVAGGVGSSTCAAAYAKFLALHGQKPLYLNMEMLGNSNVFFSGNGQYTFSDIIYAVKSKKTNLVMKLESCVKQDDSGVSFYDPCTLPLDMTELNAEEISSIIRTLKTTNSYTHIVIDADFSLDAGMFAMLKAASDVVLVADGSAVSNSKFKAFYDAFSILEKQQDLRVMSKLHIVYNKFSNKTSNELPVEGLNVLGGIPKFEHASVKQVVEQISTMDVFKNFI